MSTALRTLQSTGLLRLAANSQHRRARLLILCYHGLSLYDEHEWLPHLYTTPQQFRQRLQSLEDMRASVLPLGEALDRLHGNSLPPRSVAITFDDGFYDFYHYALPILSGFGYPCTLYLTTHYCAYRLPVITLILDYLLWKSRRSEAKFPDWGIDTPAPIRNYDERQQVAGRILRWMQSHNLNTLEKNGIARQIANSLNVDYDDLLKRRIVQIVSDDEAREISRAGIEIQLHTHRHRTPSDRDLFRKEIQDNSNYIFDLTGVTPAHFCYPSGHYLPEFLPWLNELGVKSATTCDTGLANRDSNDLALPRVLDDITVDSIRFESIVSGLFA